jgi:ribosomal protein S1
MTKSKFSVGETVTGKVARILVRKGSSEDNGKGEQRYGVVVQFGAKTNGMLHLRHIGTNTEQSSKRLNGLQVGDIIEAKIIATPRHSYGTHLSEREALQARTTETLRAVYQKGAVVTGKVKSVRIFSETSAGVLVELDGVIGMMHDSQAAGNTTSQRQQRVLALGKALGSELTLMVMEDAQIVDGKVRVALSETQLLEWQAKQRQEAALGLLKEGSLEMGKVVRLDKDALIVELSGPVEGRLPHGELGGAVLASVSKIGAKMRVKVASIASGHVLLSRKGL